METKDAKIKELEKRLLTLEKICFLLIDIDDFDSYEWSVFKKIRPMSLRDLAVKDDDVKKLYERDLVKHAKENL